MSFFESVVNIGKGIKDFIGSDTVKTIADGAKDIYEYMKEKSADMKEMGQLESLGDTNTQLGGQVSIGTSRSRAGKPSFGDIEEA